MLNSTVKQFSHKAPLALLALVLLIGGCGKRGAPVPPSERVKQRVELAGFQRGNQVILSWKMPNRNAPKGNVQNSARIDVYRLAEPVTAPQTMSVEDFANRSTLIAAMPVTDGDFGVNRTLQYKDTLQFAGQAARLRTHRRGRQLGIRGADGQRFRTEGGLLEHALDRARVKGRGGSRFPFGRDDPGCDQADLEAADAEYRRFDAG